MLSSRSLHAFVWAVLSSTSHHLPQTPTEPSRLLGGHPTHWDWFAGVQSSDFALLHRYGGGRRPPAVIGGSRRRVYGHLALGSGPECRLHILWRDNRLDRDQRPALRSRPALP